LAEVRIVDRHLRNAAMGREVTTTITLVPFGSVHLATPLPYGTNRLRASDHWMWHAVF
jgi:hypothetical protein